MREHRTDPIERAGSLIFRGALLALPRRIRRAHRAEMLHDFRHRQAMARRAGSWLALPAVWAKEVAGVLAAAGRARRGARTHSLSALPRGGSRTMDTVTQDVRYALRGLRRAPGFVAVALVALAVGIGANTAIFSVVYGVLQPLPYPDAERLVIAYEDRVGDGSGEMQLSPPEYLALESSDGIFEEVAGYRYWSEGLLRGDPQPEYVSTVRISHDFLDLLGVRPLHGRDFVESDLGGEPVVIVGHEVWQRRWNGDPGIVGETIVVSDEPHTVVGVTPADFTYFNDTDQLFFPMTVGPEQTTNNRLHALLVLGRYGRDLGFGAADEAAGAVAARAQEFGGHVSDRPTTVRLHSLYEVWVGEVRRPLLVLMGAVGLLVLIACSNVANLQIARGLRRSREVAIRLAVGAGRGRIIRQLVTESTILSLAGGIVGLAVAWLSMRPLRGLVASHLPRADNIEISLSVLAFAILLSAAAGIISGLAPAWVAGRQELARPLAEGNPALAGQRRGHYLRAAFVVLQVSLALVLAVGAGLLVRTFDELQRTDLGFDPHGSVVARLVLGGRPEYRTRDGLRAFYDELLARLRASSAIEAAGVIDMPPGTGGNITENFQVDSGPFAADPTSVGRRFASGGVFAALGLPLTRGRVFAEGEGRPGTAPVAILSEAAADRLWPGQDPLGKQIRPYDRDDPDSVPWFSVVGVVGDVRMSPLGEGIAPIVYLPFDRSPSPFESVVARTRGSLAAAVDLLRDAVAELDPGQPVPEVRPLIAAVSRTYARQRLNASLAALLAALALLLAATGVYAVVQYVVAQRSAEIGIRMALGADGGDVVRMVLRQGATLALLGVVVGLAGSWASSRLLESMLVGVRPTDPATYMAVAAFLLAIAVTACWLPSRRAACVDPVRTLRQS